MSYALLILTLLLAATNGCVAIDGGAVEGRWVLRNAEGQEVSCSNDSARIAAIRFVLEPQDGGEDPCASSGNCKFSCRLGVGTTPFVIPSGMYAMSLGALDEADTPLGLEDGVTVPAALLRTVRFGQVTNLNVSLIIVDR